MNRPALWPAVGDPGPQTRVMPLEDKEAQAYEELSKLSISPDAGEASGPAVSVDKENINIVFIGHVGKAPLSAMHRSPADAVLVFPFVAGCSRCRKVYTGRPAALPDGDGGQAHAGKV